MKYKISWEKVYQEIFATILAIKKGRRNWSYSGTWFRDKHAQAQCFALTALTAKLLFLIIFLFPSRWNELLKQKYRTPHDHHDNSDK